MNSQSMENNKMKAKNRLPLKACAIAALAAFSFSAHAEYYYVDSAPCETSPKCVSVKRYKCERRYYTRCYPKRHVVKRVKRYYYRPVVRHYEYLPPMMPSCGGSYGSCSSCAPCDSYNYYNTTRWAYVCNDCEGNLWVPGYMCGGRWVSGHWRY